MPSFSFDREKFKRLVHYVIYRAGDKAGFGATKLNKVLWFSEARQYMLTGKPIAGANYIREKWGPVPHQIMPIRSELESEGKIKVFAPKADYEGWRFKAIGAHPDMRSFTHDQMQVIDYWIDYVSNKTAKNISEESHDYGWDIARMGEKLPFHAFLANRTREPTEEELAWAKDVARRRGLA